jgi:hypothetical protein
MVASEALNIFHRPRMQLQGGRAGGGGG